MVTFSPEGVPGEGIAVSRMRMRAVKIWFFGLAVHDAALKPLVEVIGGME